MERFREDAHCLKCASPKIATAYQAPHFYWAGQDRPLGQTEPRMKRECSRCGYTWFEKPLDTPDPGDPTFNALDEKGQPKS